MMKMFGSWREAARFALGVLLVWGVASGLSGLARSVMRGDSASWRLAGGEFCTLEDFTAPNIWAPTECYVYDLEYQRSPGPVKPEPHLSIAALDMQTLVMVDHDGAKESIKKGESGHVDVDGRMVGVYFISGPLTGRKGMIARYKLIPRDTR